MGVQKSFGEKSGNKGDEPNNGENERNRTEHPLYLRRQRWSPYGIDAWHEKSERLDGDLG